MGSCNRVAFDGGGRRTSSVKGRQANAGCAPQLDRSLSHPETRIEVRSGRVVLPRKLQSRPSPEVVSCNNWSDDSRIEILGKWLNSHNRGLPEFLKVIPTFLHHQRISHELLSRAAGEVSMKIESPDISDIGHCPKVRPITQSDNHHSVRITT